MIESVPGIISAAPIALDDPADDQRGRVGRQAGGRRGEREDDDADQEDAAAAEDVAEAPAGREQHREGERVAVDRPLQAGDRGAEVLLDRRQRDVHDGVVEHDHEQREAHRSERPPLAVLVGDQVAVTGVKRTHFPSGAHRSARCPRGPSATRRRRRACGAGSAVRVAAKASIPLWRTATRVSTRSLPSAVICTWRTRRSSGSSTRVASPFLTRPSTARLIEGTETPKTSARSLTCQVSALLPEPAQLEQRLALGHREPGLLEHPQLVAAVVEEEVAEQGGQAGRRSPGPRGRLRPPASGSLDAFTSLACMSTIVAHAQLFLKRNSCACDACHESDPRG